MQIPKSYTQADAMLQGRNAQSRKVANNTYVQRRGDDIAVRLHATDIVTFHADGTMRLDSGGWLTMTTKARINDALAHGQIWSVKGRWYVYGIGNPTPYADGMTITETGEIHGASARKVAAEDKRNAKARKDIARFVKGITPERIVEAFENSGGDCFLCRFEQTSCLSEHVREGYFHATLARRAFDARGYSHSDVIASMVYFSAKRGQVDRLLTDSLGKYLRKHLLEGVATA